MMYAILDDTPYYLLEYLTTNDTIHEEDAIWVSNTLKVEL